MDFNTEGNIEMSIWTYNPEWTRKFPETLVTEFLDNREEGRIRFRDDVIKKTQSQLEKINQQIKSDFTQIRTFENSNEIRNLTIQLDQLKDVPRLRLLTKQRIEDMEGVRIKLQDPGLNALARLAMLSSVEYDLKVGQAVQGFENEGFGGTNRPRGAVVVIPSMMAREPQQEAWRAQESKLWQLQLEIAENGRIYLPRHPKMMALNRQLEQITKQLDAELASAKFRFDLNYTEQVNKSRELDDKYVLYESLSRRHAELAAQLLRMRDSKPEWAAIEAAALRDLKMLEFGGDKERVQLRYIRDPLALRADVPVSPNRLKLVLYSLALGIALAIGVPFLLEFLDQTATTMEKVEQVIQVRGLGIVPKFDEYIPEAYPLIDPENGTGGNLLEAFRVVRTNLMSSAAISKAPQVIMVTSAMPKEGKTVVASNIAMAFAQLGERTLVIDANLRRGLAHHPFRCRSTPGLSNILIDRVSVEETIRPTDFENLSLLPCGEHLDGDIEQLGSPGFLKLIDRLRQKYQRIVIDTPPVLGLSETSVMQGVVDGVVLVIWSGNTPLRSVKTAVDLLHANHANFYGFILNRLDLKATMNRFHYYYYSNHYYNRYQALEKVS